jgi:hypothetical protein
LFFLVFKEIRVALFEAFKCNLEKKNVQSGNNSKGALSETDTIESETKEVTAHPLPVAFLRLQRLSRIPHLEKHLSRYRA